MKITLKEAHRAAQKALPEYIVQVEVSLGSAYSWQNEKGVSWTISARPNTKDGDSKRISESDELFSVALAKLVAEARKVKSKPVSDVEVEDVEAGESKEEEVAGGEGEDKQEETLNV